MGFSGHSGKNYPEKCAHKAKGGACYSCSTGRDRTILPGALPPVAVTISHADPATFDFTPPPPPGHNFLWSIADR